MRPWQQASPTQTLSAHHPCHSERSEESKIVGWVPGQDLRFFAALRMTKGRGCARTNYPSRAIAFAPFVAFVLLSAGCNTGDRWPTASYPSATATVASPPTATSPSAAGTAHANALAAELGKLFNAESIHIEDHWNGLSRVAPISAEYSLVRSADGFKGDASFSVGRHGGPVVLTATESITIPIDVGESFLKELANVPLQAGEYTPRIEHTDDYPSLAITIGTGYPTVRFYSQSQGEDHAPWGANIRDKPYTISTGQPAEALSILEPYLKKDVLDKLINDAQSTP